MKRLRIVVALLAIAMMVGSSAWAFNGTDHVKVAPNGKGDMLIFPWFLVGDNGISSKISVINTSNNYSVVAKVIYRSFNWSQEVLDHLIYLSPNDVWVASIEMVNGKATLVCNDDSMLGNSTEFADKVPVKQPLATPSKGGVAWDNDGNTFGYVEVIESVAIPAIDAAAGPITKTDGKIAKSKIKAVYDDPAVLPSNPYYSPKNVLTGYQENSNGVNRTFTRARVFADYGNTAKLNVVNETYLGLLSRNTVAEVEAAIASLDVALPYLAKVEGDWTLHFFNFPTKVSGYNSTAPKTYKPYTESPYWTLVAGADAQKCERFGYNIYDLLENSPTNPGSIFSPVIETTPQMCYEVNPFSIVYTSGSLFAEGWVRYNWANTGAPKTGDTREKKNAITYLGSPVLSSAVIFNSNAKAWGWAEAESAYSYAPVVVDGVAYPYYPFSN